MAQSETLAQLVTRLRTEKYGPNRRDADRATGISYSNWQNIEVRGTQPTLATLTRLAAALDVSDFELSRAWRVSQAAKDAAKAAEAVDDLDRGIAASRRRRHGNRPSNGPSSKRGQPS